MGLTLWILPDRFAICRLPLNGVIPEPPADAELWSVTRTGDELSIVLPERNARPGWKTEAGWRCLRVQGPLDLTLTGILASLLDPLRDVGVSVFTISTYDTDYVLVREDDLEEARQALTESGHRFASD